MYLISPIYACSYALFPCHSIAAPASLVSRRQMVQPPLMNSWDREFQCHRVNNTRAASNTPSHTHSNLHQTYQQHKTRSCITPPAHHGKISHCTTTTTTTRLQKDTTLHHKHANQHNTTTTTS